MIAGMNTKITTHKAEGLRSAEREAGMGEQIQKAEKLKTETLKSGAFGEAPKGTCEPPVLAGAETLKSFRTGTEMLKPGEERFLKMLADFMRVAKSSDDPGVGDAARRWEPTVGFNVKIQLQRRAQRRKPREKRIVLTAPVAIVTSNGSAGPASPSSLQIQVGGPPSQA
jgi:hypothetical protein